MPGHVDILDQPEPIGKAFAGSLVFHASFIALIIGAAVVHPGKPEQWGDPNGGRFGAVAVNSVATIPLPNRGGPQNPVANDTESHVPTPPPAKKVKPKLDVPDPNAIPL